jgi:hypothetical protein
MAAMDPCENAIRMESKSSSPRPRPSTPARLGRCRGYAAEIAVRSSIPTGYPRGRPPSRQLPPWLARRDQLPTSGNRGVAAGVSQGHALGGVAVSATGQIGQSEAIHSPEAWASMVVRLSIPGGRVDRGGSHRRDLVLA